MIMCPERRGGVWGPSVKILFLLLLLFATTLSPLFGQINYAPVASHITASKITTIDRQLLQPIMNGSDAYGDQLSYVITSLPSKGTLHNGNISTSLVAGTVLTEAEFKNLYYTPPVTYVLILPTLSSGVYPFSYYVKDHREATSATMQYNIPVSTDVVPSATSRIITPVSSASGQVSIPALSGTGNSVTGFVASPPSTSQGVIHYSTTATGTKLRLEAPETVITGSTVFLWFTPSPEFSSGVASFTYRATNSIGTTPSTQSATYSIPIYPEPAVKDIVNQNVAKNAGERSINPITAISTTDSISSFTLSNIPDSGVGTLKLQGVPITSGTFVATSNQLSQLTFEPSPTMAAGVTSFMFNFKANTPSGHSSRTQATYTIPLTNDVASVYSVQGPYNKDLLQNSSVLATVSDPDGAITSAVIASGQLPFFLELNPLNGTIKVIGQPKQVAEGTFTATIKTVDACGGWSVSTVSIVIFLDRDGDGFANTDDADSDNDGISNLVESQGANPFADHDSDGILNYMDADYSTLNSYGVCAIFDKDGDGIINAMDLDSDNDGIPDAVEANKGKLPANMQASGNYSVAFLKENDSNGNGLADGTDILTGGTALPNGDKDNDGIPNALDLESDGDGLLDAIEANNGFLPAGMLAHGQYPASFLDTNDTDLNGLADALSSAPLSNSDVDNDGLPNFLDLDSDNDGIRDWLDGQPIDTIIYGKGIDTNNNGIDDAFDATVSGGLAVVPIDSDQDNIPDFLDLDSDNDGIPDFVEAYDLNKNGDVTDDLLLLAKEFSARAANTPAENYYPYTKAENGDLPGWLNVNTNGKLNFLVPRTSNPSGRSTLYYFDTDNDGQVDLYDSNSYGTEPSPEETDLSYRTATEEPLPVHITSFEARPLKDGVLVSWVTMSEVENDYFLLEKSYDAQSFKTVGKIKGAGNSSVRVEYNFKDTKVASGTIYYRLKQVDFNLKTEFSKIIAVKSTTTNAVVQRAAEMYPNPTTDLLTIQLPYALDSPAEILVYRQDGSIALKQPAGFLAKQVINLQSLPPGTYVVMIKGESVAVAQKVIKQ